MKIRRRGRRQPMKSLEPLVWSSAYTLERVRYLNEKYLAAVAASTQGEDMPCSIKAINLYRDLWRRMDARLCGRIAHIPVLLADLYFESPKWWRWIARQGPQPVRTAGASEPLPITSGTPLLREMLLEACVIARSHPSAARLVLGMSPPVVAAISDLQASEIDSIAVTYARDLQLRWSDNLIFWRNLLLAAVGGSEAEIAAVRLHSLQLLANNS